MKRIYSYNNQEHILYLVATPIGNLEDMTFRAVNVLKSVDRIYAEDTRNSKVLLERYDIKTPLYTYHEFNKELKEDEIVDFIKEGFSVAIISDAGLPVISDPGFDIAKRCIKEDIPVTPIPGASAGISALIASGLPPKPFMFYGFLDSKTTKRKQELEALKYLSYTTIYYEAPHRIKEMLDDLLEVFGNREICIGRELTKKFEEFIHGSISEVLEQASTFKGEMVVIVEGAREEEASGDPIEKINVLIKLGYKPKEAIKEVALIYKLDKRELYDSYVESKNKESQL